MLREDAIDLSRNLEKVLVEFRTASHVALCETSWPFIILKSKQPLKVLGIASRPLI